MNQNAKKSPRTPASPCLCLGAGPLMSEFLRRLGPPEEARRHFESARLEILRGLRALLDARIERLSRTSRKGEKIKVE